jgi:hypothetical protein
MAAGPVSLLFNGLDDDGRRLASGVLFARVTAAGQSGVMKMVMVK